MIFDIVHNAEKLHRAGSEDTAKPKINFTPIPQNPMSPSHSNVALQPRLNQEHPIEEVESTWNTSELYLKSSFGRLHPINFEFLFRNSRTLSSVVILGAVQTWIFSLSNAVSFTGLITYFSFSPTLLAEYAYVLAEGVSHFCKHFFRMLSCYWEKPM